MQSGLLVAPARSENLPDHKEVLHEGLSYLTATSVCSY